MIASSGAGVPTFAPVMPVIGFVVTCPRSRPGFSPTCPATRLIVDSAVTKFETRPERGRRGADRGRAAGRERLPEVDLGGRLVRRRMGAERDQVADHEPGDEAADRQPPARRDRAPVAAEIDLLLGVDVGRGRRAGGPSSWRGNPTGEPSHGSRDRYAGLTRDQPVQARVPGQVQPVGPGDDRRVLAVREAPDAASRSWRRGRTCGPSASRSRRRRRSRSPSRRSGRSPRTSTACRRSPRRERRTSRCTSRSVCAPSTPRARRRRSRRSTATSAARRSTRRTSRPCRRSSRCRRARTPPPASSRTSRGRPGAPARTPARSALPCARSSA